MTRYLARRIKVAAQRNQQTNVRIGIQIFDELVHKCHTEMRLFLQQYLNTLLDLLTGPNNFIKDATDSFERFTTIDADTPVYGHMSPEFIRVFSSLCWCTDPKDDSSDDAAVRMCGLRGLAAVVEKDRELKTGSVVYDEHSLGQIIPALLFNVTKGDHLTPASLIIRRRNSNDTTDSSEDIVPSNPPQLASHVLQVICEHATVASTKAVLRPIFGYLADFGLWEEREDGVASYAITLILSSLQGQLVHIMCDELVLHLDTRDTLGALAKRSIIKAISSVCTSASSIPFTYVLNIYNTILTHLRQPIANATSGDRQLLEDSIVAACADVASTLPSPQKISILITIFTKVPTTQKAKAQHQLIECARGAANTLEVSSLSASLPDALLRPLLLACTHNHEDVMASAAALLYDLLQCPLEVSSSRALTKTGDGARPLTPQRSSVGSLILDSVKSVVSRPRQTPELTAGQSMQATRPDISFVSEKLRLILWHIFEAVRKTTSPSCTALEHLGAVCVHLGAYFGVAAMVTVVRTLLALLRPPAPASAVHAAFVAVVLKRISFARGAEHTAALIDDLVTACPDVQSAARALGPRDVFDFSSADDSDGAVFAIDRATLVAQLVADGFKEQDVADIARLPYEHPARASEVDGQQRRRPQLRPLIRVESTENVDEATSSSEGAAAATAATAAAAAGQHGGRAGFCKTGSVHSARRLQFRRAVDKAFGNVTFEQLCSFQPTLPAAAKKAADAEIFEGIEHEAIGDIAVRVLKSRSSNDASCLLSNQWQPITPSPFAF